MLIVNVWNKFPNQKFQKAPEMGKWFKIYSLEQFV